MKPLFFQSFLLIVPFLSSITIHADNKISAQKTLQRLSVTKVTKMVRICLATVKMPVRKNEMIEAKLQTDDAGKKYWKVRVAINPPTPEGVRFLQFYDSKKINYISAAHMKNFIFVDGRCKEIK